AADHCVVSKRQSPVHHGAAVDRGVGGGAEYELHAAGVDRRPRCESLFFSRKPGSRTFDHFGAAIQKGVEAKAGSVALFVRVRLSLKTEQLYSTGVDRSFAGGAKASDDLKAAAVDRGGAGEAFILQEL